MATFAAQLPTNPKTEMTEVVKEGTTTIEVAKQLGLLPEEFQKIQQIMGRVPNFTELSIFSVMWSEHCSYKNSIHWLKTLPKEGPDMLAEAGEENAGLVDIGDGLACAFKIESHNHPSAIEPFQGAATGVGGINRDIFTMGARPIAQLNSLRFGDPNLERTKWLVRGVVDGIGTYGNSFGIPVVGGEVFFDSSYNANPLINAMSAGIVHIGKTISATSHGAGNKVFIVGSSTGKDGIHGATFASGDLSESSSQDLPSVQVGDPFQEKLLLEASLELVDMEGIIGMQDMGAAGITCSTSEMSAKGEHGMVIHLDRVPTRQEGMKPFEILLSESQERMLVVVKLGHEAAVTEVFDKWDLNCVEIGEVVEGSMLQFYMHGDLVAEVPASELVLGGGAPVYQREIREPAYFQQTKAFKIASVPEPNDLKDVAFKLLAHPNIASKRWVIQQYDSMVGTANMNTNGPSDAGLVNIKGTKKALALTVDCNARYVHADPEQGAAMAVAEAARNVVCSGAEPKAITNCLNFGNPYNPEAFWQFVGAIKGMGKACRYLNTPVTGGNVSFYNQTVSGGKEEPVFPTPTIGMLGLLRDKSKAMTMHFKNAGDVIYLLGENPEDINCSEYLYSVCGVKLSPPPHFDLEEEQRLQQLVLKMIDNKLIVAAHDCAEGGIFITLAEMGMFSKMGFDTTTKQGMRKDAFLFGEAQGRVIVSVPPAMQNDVEAMAAAVKVSVTLLGHVTTGAMQIDGASFGSIEDAIRTYELTLPSLFGN